MSKRNLLNLGLFIFIIILVIFIVIEPGKEIAKKPQTLTQLSADTIQHIKITRQATSDSESELEFQKTATGWQMLKPYALPANPFRIDSILSVLSTTSFSQNDLTGLNKKTFGLEQPRASIILNKKYPLIFGHNKSLKNHRYVQVDSTLHMITDTYFYQLAAKAESYIDHKVIPENATITQLTLPNLKLEKSGAGWTTTPKKTKFGTDSINQLIDEWRLSQAFDIKIEQPQPDSSADITVQLNNQDVIRFKILGSTENFILLNIDSGIRYILSKDRQDKLLQLNAIES